MKTVEKHTRLDGVDHADGRRQRCALLLFMMFIAGRFHGRLCGQDSFHCQRGFSLRCGSAGRTSVCTVPVAVVGVAPGLVVEQCADMGVVVMCAQLGVGCGRVRTKARVVGQT